MKTRKFTVVVAAALALLLSQAALADTITFTGTVSASQTHEIYAPIGGTVEAVAREVGQKVAAGDALYIRCTADGTHRALGVITEIDGSEYRVLTLGGELYLGETVYLYRDADFTAAQRVGIGTVVATDAQSYTAEGVLTRLLVDEGDTVERGQLLYEIGGGSVEAPISGIVSSVSVRAGEKVQADQAVAEIVPEDQICVEIELDEADAARIVPGQAAMLLPTSGGDEDDGIPGMVLDVSWVPSDGTYTARVLPEDASALALGMSVTVRI